MKRVVITGIGAVSPSGNSFREAWSGIISGMSGVGEIHRFGTSGMRWKTAGELKGFEADRYLGPKEIRRLDPFIHYAVAAAFMAAEDAGLMHAGTANPFLASGGVIIGSSRGGISTIEDAVEKYYKRNGRKTGGYSAYLMPSTTISMAASYVAQKIGIKGYCLGVSNACASGANAIGEAFRLIRSGYEGPVFAGGAEAPLCRLCVEGYGISGVLSETSGSFASRPFDRSRDGFVIAEGAAVMVLEALDDAIRRGTRIYGEITGYGNTTDAFDQTRPSPEGEVRAIQAALADAGLQTEEIDYINAHGTSTRIGDWVETETITSVLGDKTSSVPVSALKSITGHMLAASAAFEAACTAMTVKTGLIPPTINLTAKDEDCNLNIITAPVKADINNAISQSFGFGGVNAVLVIKKFE